MDHDKQFIFDAEVVKEPKGFSKINPNWDKFSDGEKKLRIFGAIAICVFAFPVFLKIITHNKYLIYLYWVIVIIIIAYIAIDQYKKHYGK
jgi:hypothetical protein